MNNMRTFLMSLVTFVSGECMALGASNAEVIIALLGRATPVEAASYRRELREFAVNEDSAGAQQYLFSAYWERSPIVSEATPSQASVSVMRTSSEGDADRIFDRGLMFASAGFSPHGGLRQHGEWGTSRKVVEFGYPRILMKFGDVLVAFQDYAQMADSEKLALIAEFEDGVQEWRKRRAEVNDPIVVAGPDAAPPVPSPAPRKTAPEVIDAPESGVGPSSRDNRTNILKAVLAVVCLLLAWVVYKRRKHNREIIR